MQSFSRSHKITIVGGYLCSHWSEENTGIKQIPIIGIKKIPWGIGIFCEDRELRCIYLPNLNLNFNSTQKDEETELHTAATADKEVVDVQLAAKIEKENPIAVVLDQEIVALQINNDTIAYYIEMALYEAVADKTPPVEVRGTCCGWRVHCSNCYHPCCLQINLTLVQGLLALIF